MEERLDIQEGVTSSTSTLDSTAKDTEYNTLDVELSLIRFDKNNPRSESEEKILEDPQFQQLCESIKEHGVLTPLIIRNDGTGFVLIDGERRLRASLYVKRVTAPAIIVQTDISGRILAYQVHMLRKDWSKINEIKSVKIIVDDIIKDNPEINDADLKKKLKEITNALDAHIDDWLILLKYNDEIIKKVIDDKFPMSHLIRNERDFLNKIKSKYPSILIKLPENKIREILALKAEQKLLGKTRYLMDVFKDVFEIEQKTDEIKDFLLQFLETDACDIKDTYANIHNLFIQIKEESADKGKEETKAKTTQESSTGKDKPEQPKNRKKEPKTEKTKDEISESSGKKGIFEYKSISISPKEFKKINDIRPKFESIGSSFSNEEFEYVSEALYCLETHCFKASTLMIWSTGISRILSYIEKDLLDFNTSCDTMKNKKSVYRYLVPSFKTNATSIEELRLCSNDMQLISFMFFKNFINDTEFKKLKANYDYRCGCAHPTLLTLSPNEIITIFENVYTLILNNQKMK